MRAKSRQDSDKTGVEGGWRVRNFCFMQWLIVQAAEKLIKNIY